MGLNTETEEVKKSITLLTNPRANFVSLVKHAASRQPFRVVKAEKGGNKTVKSMVVQSILLPNGTTIGDLSSKSGMNWLSEVSAEKSESFDSFTKLTQVSVEKFDEGSIKLVKLDGSGAFALAGQLIPDSGVENVITLGEEDTAKAADLPTAPMDAIVGNPDANAVLAQKFADLFDRETYSMLDVVHGLLRQSATDSKKRKSAVLAAIDGYKSFISMGLDALDKNAAKLDGKPDKFTKPAEDQNQLTDKGEVEMFKTKDEFTNAVVTILDARDARKRETEDTKAQEAAAKKRDEDFATLTDTVQKMAETVNTLVKKTEKLDGESDTDAAAKDGDTADADAKKSDTADTKDGDTKETPAKTSGVDMSVFSGLLTAKA